MDYSKNFNKMPTAVTPRLIIGLGELLWDVYPDNMYLGGAPANFAYHINRLGHTGLILSRVGTDALGDKILNELKRADSDTTWIQRDEVHPTGTVEVTLSKNGIPSFKCTKNVAFDYLQIEKKWSTLTTKADAILFGSLAQRNPIARSSIQHFIGQAHDALKVYDINIRGWNKETQEIVQQSLHLADVIKLNESEFKILDQFLGLAEKSLREKLRFLLDEFKLVYIALTLGEKGCLLVSREEIAYSPGFILDITDTTGAGDTFAAGFVHMVFANSDLKATAEFANALGALISTKKGATPEWDMNELHNLLQTNPNRTFAEEFKEFF